MIEYFDPRFDPPKLVSAEAPYAVPQLAAGAEPLPRSLWWDKDGRLIEVVGMANRRFCPAYPRSVIYKSDGETFVRPAVEWYDAMTAVGEPEYV